MNKREGRNMIVTDKFTRGFLAGLIGGISMDIVDYISSIFNIVKVTYADWAGYMLFGEKPRNILEITVGLIGHIFFCGILGVLFAYLIVAVKFKYLLFKAWIFGLTIWTIMYSISVLAHLYDLSILYLDTVLSDMVTSSIFGLSLGYAYKLLTNRKELT